MPATEARVEAQAKINLFLRVFAREANGYHQIETLFCRIALADTVTVRATSSGRSLDCHGDRMPAGGLGPVEKNLAWRAASAYADATGFPSGFEIAIDKKIPVGGGLGGGSADAGGVLRALNALNPQPMDPGALLRIAVTLGADVPFLTQDDSVMALGRGYGERLEPVAALPQRMVWLVIPHVGVNTGDAYRWLDESERAMGTPAVTGAEVSTWEGLAAIAANDFEPVVSSHVPIIGRLLAAFRSPELKEALGDSAIAQLSGSGSTVFVAAGPPPGHWVVPRAMSEIEIVETQTATFVEPVVMTH